MPEVHSKHGFKVEELTPKAGGQAVEGSSIPLILPNNMKYNASTGVVETVQGARPESMQVVPEALELLEGIKEPVSVLAICGPCRTGKSYILSRLLGTADAFELGHRMDPQTFGIWMGTKVLRGKDFTIVLLDTEGIDAAGASADQDARILVLTILTSSLLIYNSLNVPLKGDLEKMQCFIKLSKSITVKEGGKKKMAAFSEFFPDFLWLLRDVSLKPTDKDGKEMDPTDYLKTRVLGREEEEDDFETTCDQVGRAILTFFSSVECAILQRPSAEADTMNNIAKNEKKLNPAFNKGVEDLIERLLQNSRAKRGYDKGSTVSGVALSIMTKQYVEAINDPKAIPTLDNTWKNTIQLMRRQAIDEVILEYNQHMQDLVASATENGQVPLEEATENSSGKSTSQPTLMDLHHQATELVTDMLLEKIGHLGINPEGPGNENTAVVKEMQQCLIQHEKRTVDYLAADNTVKKQEGLVVTGGKLFQYIMQNKELSKTFCQKLFEDLYDPIRKQTESPPQNYDFEQLMQELDGARQQYCKQARGPEKWVVLQEMTKDLENLTANFKKIKGFQRKLMKEKQKKQQADLLAKEKAREVQQLYDQQKDMQQAHQETMEKMKQQQKEQINKIIEQENERRRQEERKYQDLQNANMERYAAMQRDYQEKSEAQSQGFMTLLRQQQEDLRNLVEKITLRDESPPDVAQEEAGKEDDGCTIL